jgi:hypothetical protein
MASRGQEHAVELYYTLYNPNRFREVASTYQVEPRLWEAGKSPVICEASPSNEVGLLAQRLYGLESIPRLGFTAHPAAEPRILLYPAMCRLTRQVPVLLQDLRHPSTLDLVLAEGIRPFWEKGEGMITCPICLMVPKAGGVGFTPAAYGRSAYLQHWESTHYSSYVASCTFSATQLHTRIYMGHSLYTLALANRRNGKDSPTGRACNYGLFRSLNIDSLDYTLAKAYPSVDQPKTPEDQQEPPIVDISMEDVQPETKETTPAKMEVQQKKEATPRKFPRKAPVPKTVAASPASVGASPASGAASNSALRPAPAVSFICNAMETTDRLMAAYPAMPVNSRTPSSTAASTPTPATSTPKGPISKPPTFIGLTAEHVQFMRDIQETIGEEEETPSKPDLLGAAMEAIGDPTEDVEMASAEAEVPFTVVKKGKKKK